MKKMPFLIVPLVVVVFILGITLGRTSVWNRVDSMIQHEQKRQQYIDIILAALNEAFEPENPARYAKNDITLQTMERQDYLKQKLAEYYNSIDEPYYHCYELCLMPDFAEGEQPGWDEVSRWLCSFAEYNPEVYSWTAADLQAAADVLLPDYTVPREDSAYLEYDAQNDSFAALGWDAPPDGEYYQFGGIGFKGGIDESSWLPHWKDTSYLYCRIYKWDEMWYAGQGENSAALLAYAKHFGYTEENMPEMNVPAAFQALLSGEYVKDEFGRVLRLKPEEELQASATLSVTFRLSGDKNLPFTYLAAEREAIEES